jgi:hypothetical protein
MINAGQLPMRRHPRRQEKARGVPGNQTRLATNTLLINLDRTLDSIVEPCLGLMKAPEIARTRKLLRNYSSLLHGHWAASLVSDRHRVISLAGLTESSCDGPLALSCSTRGFRQVTTQWKSGKQPGGHEANRTSREWTAVDKFKLKGLAKQGYSAKKIARVLRRPVDTTIAVASKLGYCLLLNEPADARREI